jgi:5'-nucleotidase
VKIVVTNDDGIDAPGIQALVEGCLSFGHEPMVVAPSEDMSGAAAAIGKVRADQRIVTRRVTLPRCPEVPAHAVSGPPGLAAMAACLGAFGRPPDAVLSGINSGPNTGHAILHSGTVGAALTAATFGVSALAVSVEVSEPMRWATACALVEPTLERLCAAPAGSVLNLNVPAVPPDPLPELRWARLDRFGSVRVAVAGTSEGSLQMEYRSTGIELDPESDTALLEQGFATVTAIEGIAEVAPDDLPRWGADRTKLRALLRRVPADSAREDGRVETHSFADES